MSAYMQLMAREETSVCECHYCVFGYAALKRPNEAETVPWVTSLLSAAPCYLQMTDWLIQLSLLCCSHHPSSKPTEESVGGGGVCVCACVRACVHVYLCVYVSMHVHAYVCYMLRLAPALRFMLSQCLLTTLSLFSWTQWYPSCCLLWCGCVDVYACVYDSDR